MSDKFDVVGTLDGWKEGDLPGDQMVVIVLKSFATSKIGIELTSFLASEKEVDDEIDSLIEGLEDSSLNIS